MYHAIRVSMNPGNGTQIPHSIFNLQLLARTLLTGLLFLSSSHILPAQDAAVDQRSPRAVFRSYLVNMVAYSSTEDQAAADSALERAVSCINLVGIPAALREERGAQAARDLKSFLDRYEFVDLEEIPETIDATRYVWRKPSAEAEISLTLGSDSLWHFSRKTVESLPALLELVHGREIVEGVEASIAPETLSDLIRSHLPESLRRRSVYFENWQWIMIILILIIGLFIERIVISVFSKWVIRFMRRGKPETDFRLDRQLLKPLGIFAMAFSWSLMLRLIDLPLQAATILFFATQFVIVASGVWAAYRLVDLIAGYFASLAERTESKFDDLLVPMIRRALKILVIAFGLLFIADNLNVDITSLLAGLGIGGIAFALAAKDTVENLFGSLTVMFDKPFEIGDWVKVGDLEGTVEEVGFRSTRIRTFYNSQITMPNSRLVSSAVDNMGRRRYRRISAKLGVQYDTPPEKIDAFCEGIRELVRLHPYTRKDMYMVYFNEFADFSLNILLYVFHEAPDWPTELRERHRLFTDILRLARRLGIEFAFPTQTLHIASTPDSASGANVMPAKDRGGREATLADGAGLGEAAIFGRQEAEALIRELWGSGTQQPVSFNDPASMGPARENPGEYDSPQQ